MRYEFHINPAFEKNRPFIESLPLNFEREGKTIYKGRNEIKVFEVDGKVFNVKAFKVPNFLNQMVYGLFRPSKASRSYSYSLKLKDIGDVVPEPVAFIHEIKWGFLKRSFYICQHFDYDFTIREVVLNNNFPDREKVLEEFTEFAYNHLHQHGVVHKDFSPGNILIKKSAQGYHFQVVDINRMVFCPLTPEKGLENLDKLWAEPGDLEIIGRTYGKLSGLPEKEAITLLKEFDGRHKNKALAKKHRKERIKRLFK